MPRNTKPAAQICRQEILNGHFRYFVDGKVHTNRSNRHYDAASVYRTTAAHPKGAGQLRVWLHRDQAVAANGSPDANRLVKAGTLARVGGVHNIQAITVAPTNPNTKESTMPRTNKKSPARKTITKPSKAAKKPLGKGASRKAAKAQNATPFRAAQKRVSRLTRQLRNTDDKAQAKALRTKLTQARKDLAQLAK